MPIDFLFFCPTAPSSGNKSRTYLIEHTLPSTIQRTLEEDLSFYRKILNSSASTILQEQLVVIVSEFMLKHKDQFYPGSQEEYQIAIRFCAGGLSNLYRDWFSGKLPYTLEELTQLAEALIHRIIGKWTQNV